MPGVPWGREGGSQGLSGVEEQLRVMPYAEDRIAGRALQVLRSSHPGGEAERAVSGMRGVAEGARIKDFFAVLADPP